jgi:hypothetical protein
MNTYETFREQGNEYLYSSTPTPAILHNYYQKQLSPGIRNGAIYKGVFRPEHTVYHHAAGLANAQMDRYQNTPSLISAFHGATSKTTSTDTVLTLNRNAIAQLIGMVDKGFLDRLHMAAGGVSDHNSQVQSLAPTLVESPDVTVNPFDLTLTAAERAYWSSGVSNYATDTSVKAHLWEQCAYAFKLISAGVVRTVALEFCNGDFHPTEDRPYRPEVLMRAYGTQIGYPLARLIASLKQAGIYDKTVIAVHTTDGSRGPDGGSYGNTGKNSVILAGGGIRGGYYGDIHWNGDYVYYPPDPNSGAPVGGYHGNDGRLNGATIWKTAMRAAGIPSSLYNSFADVRSSPELNFLIR